MQIQYVFLPYEGSIGVVLHHNTSRLDARFYLLILNSFLNSLVKNFLGCRFQYFKPRTFISFCEELFSIDFKLNLTLKFVIKPTYVAFCLAELKLFIALIPATFILIVYYSNSGKEYIISSESL